MSKFTKVKAPRSFGSISFVDEKTGSIVHWHELIDGRYVETPEYKEKMKNE